MRKRRRPKLRWMDSIERDFVEKGGTVARWLERATDYRVVAVSNPTEAAWKLGQFRLPRFASV